MHPFRCILLLCRIHVLVAFSNARTHSEAEVGDWPGAVSASILQNGTCGYMELQIFTQHRNLPTSGSDFRPLNAMSADPLSRPTSLDKLAFMLIY